MFDTGIAGEAADGLSSAVSCADVLAGSVVDERRVVARRFAAVAAWADLHCPDAETVGLPERPDASPEGRRRRLAVRQRLQVGADGTPPVTRAGLVELGMLLQTSTGSAQALLRDVLELRHRLPRHWDAVRDGRLDGWKARQVAGLTRRLTRDQARVVDTQVLDAVIGLPWGRAKDVVEGRVIAIDQAAHAARLAEDEHRRFVSTRRGTNAAGLRTLIARGHAGDIARLEAMVAHLAALLEAAGDTSAADFRRAKAFAMLANPALTCVFLAQAHDKAPAHDQVHDGDAAPAHDAGGPSAVELAAAFGRVLQQLGAKAIARLRPKSVLYLHLAAEAVQGCPGTGVARVEGTAAGGPIGLDQLKAWLGHDRVTVRPVIDPTGAEPVDGYEIAEHLREAVRILTPFETFPYGTASTRHVDIDHSKPYVPIDKGGPPGQTALDNLGPLGRRHHLAKTFDGFTVHQPTVGVYLWRTPTGHWYRVDQSGTTALGTTPPALQDSPAAGADPDGPMERYLRELIRRAQVA